MVKILNKCNLSILVYNLFLDIHRIMLYVYTTIVQYTEIFQYTGIRELVRVLWKNIVRIILQAYHLAHCRQ